MASVVSEENYQNTLISKIKEQTKPKKLKKHLKSLRNLAIEELKGFPELKIKIFKEEKEQEKKPELIIVAPIIGFQHYSEDFNKSNSKQNVSNIVNCEEDNTLSTVDDDKEELKQVDSSDFSDE